MPPISKLIERTRAFDGPKKKLDRLFLAFTTDNFSIMERDSRFTGNLQSVTEFLAWFRDLVNREKPEGRLREERLQALDLVNQCLHADFSRRTFLCIDPYKFFIQAIFRIRKPEMIDQLFVPFCGPSATLVAIARKQPLKLTKLALGLFMDGHAMLDDLEVVAPYLIRNHYRSFLIGHFDHVVLGSFRHSPAALLKSITSNAPLALASPALLCRWLQGAGYHVEDHTFFNVTESLKLLEYPRDEATYGPRSASFRPPLNLTLKKENLRRMAEEIQVGNNVIMLGNGAFVMGGDKPLSHSGNYRPYLLTKLHWTYVTKLILNEVEVINAKLYTFGKVAHRSGIPIDIFISRYAGYVSFRDLRT